MHKKTVLIIIGNYLPGFKSGGILRSVENTINYLSNEFRFIIVTRNHDVGEVEPYSHIESDKWNKIGNANVYYLSNESTSFSKICELLNQTAYDFIHINSFFDVLSIKVNLAMRVNKIKKVPLILSPRGEFAEASFNIKFYRKYFFVKLVKILRLYSHTKWHVSSEYEMFDLVRVMKVPSCSVSKAIDLPAIVDNNKDRDSTPNLKDFKIIFLSRISIEKNLDMAIDILSKVESQVVFDIYGMIVDQKYWDKCKKMIGDLPKNVEVKYCGIVEPSETINVFSKYDLFLFPTGGENYGHVIAESLSAGTKVLISKNTPWLNLENKGLGWDIEIEDQNSFIEVIERMTTMEIDDRMQQREIVKINLYKWLSDSKALDDNRSLYITKKLT